MMWTLATIISKGGEVIQQQGPPPAPSGGTSWITPDVLHLILVIVATLITLYIEWKRRGAKNALIGVMKTIQKHKENGDKELRAAAEMMAEAIRTDYSKKSATTAIRKTAELIDAVYDAEVKAVKDMTESVEADLRDNPEDGPSPD